MAPIPVVAFVAAGSSGLPATLVAQSNAASDVPSNEVLYTLATAYGFNATEQAWDQLFVATVFKNAAVTASGATTIWTPSAGKRFRLMGYTLSISGTLAATGTQAIELLDGATVIAQHGATVNSATPQGDTQIGVDYGNGYLSVVVNNVLSINLSATMLTGAVYVNAWGTEN